MHERGEALSQASGMQAAQRIADIVKLLEPLDPAARRRIVQVFSAPPLTISLDQGRLETQVMAFVGLVIGTIVVLMYFPIFELAGSIE